MPRKFYKHKLLLDEGFLLRQRLPILNSYFDVRHITVDLGHEGLRDKEVYQLGIKLKRIIVTFNDKDFRNFPQKNQISGVIGVSANLTADQIDKKLTALLIKAGKKELLGNFMYISGES
jgi:predicted nuclease of predicted toxin-antitoxin system